MKPFLATIAATSALSILPACSQEVVDLDVPYVPTSQDLVETMLDMVDLRDGDVVWDLGCGDGRMVITAAKRKNIRGVGVDIDPERIRESKENAKKAGVEDKVDFRVADLFKTDFSDATVLTMYLLETVNRKLRPVILRDLQPGARIVSNTFTMGEWPHDDIKESDNGSFQSTAYFWIVPANLTGEWTWQTENGGGSLKIDQKFQTFSGTAVFDGKEQALENGKIKGREITFVIRTAGQGEKNHTATADGDVMTGTIDGKEWKAKRNPGTRVPLDPVEPAADAE